MRKQGADRNMDGRNTKAEGRLSFIFLPAHVLMGIFLSVIPFFFACFVYFVVALRPRPSDLPYGAFIIASSCFELTNNR